MTKKKKKIIGHVHKYSHNSKILNAFIVHHSILHNDSAPKMEIERVFIRTFQSNKEVILMGFNKILGISLNV